MIRNVRGLLAAVLAGTVLVSGCGGSQVAKQEAPAKPAQQGQAQTQPDAKSPIVIGVVTSLTGPNAGVGQQTAMGAKQAASEWNAKGGVNGSQVEVVVEDDGSNPSQAVNAFNKLVSEKKPAAFVLPLFTPFVMAIEPELKKVKVPALTGASGVVVTRSGDGWFFRVRTNDENVGQLAAKYVMEDLGSKKPAIIYPNNDFGKGAFDVIKKAVDAKGTKFAAAESFNQTDKDISAQLLNIKRSGADVLVAWMVPADAGMITKQIRQLGLQMTVVGNGSFSQEDYYQLVKEQADGIHTLADTMLISDKQTKWVAEVQKNFPNQPVSQQVAVHYDGVNMMLEAIKKVGTDPVKIREALLATKGYAGISGSFSFDKEGNGLHQQMFGVWKGGKLEYKKTVVTDN